MSDPAHSDIPDVAEDLRRTLAILQRRNRNLRRVNEVSRQLASMLDAREALDFLLAASAEIIGTPTASLWLWDDARAGLTLHAAHPPHALGHLSSHRTTADAGLAGWAIANRASAVTGDASTDTRLTPHPIELPGDAMRSVLAVPLIVRDKALGVIELLSSDASHFDEEDLAMVETLAAAAAIALDNATLVTTLRANAMQLSVRNAELDAFAHTVAHDLKIPLATILGYSDYLLASDYDIGRDELKEICRSIARTSAKMNGIIEELLLLSVVRPTAEVEIGPLDMHTIVGEAVGRLESMLSSTRARLITPESWPIARGYAPWVEEIWANYISNAINYGGEPPEITLGYSHEGEQVWFSVSDNGNGLSTEEQAHLFMPYRRPDGSTALGHGLGLSIVSRIVARLDGEVAVRSAIGAGSTFLFSLPAA